LHGIAAGGVACAIAISLGCSTLPPAPEPTRTPEANKAQALRPAQQWSGRFAIDGEPASAATAVSGRFRLEQNDSMRRLELVGPLGQTLARLELNAEGAQLTYQDGRIERANDASQLIENALGWPLPVTALMDWLSGDFAHVTERDADGTPRVAIDQSWRIERESARRWHFLWPANPPAAAQGTGPLRSVRVRLLLDP
jgi:outer membrane lipoprotein LolB